MAAIVVRIVYSQVDGTLARLHLIDPETRRPFELYAWTNVLEESLQTGSVISFHQSGCMIDRVEVVS